MKELISLTSEHFEIINKAKKALGKLWVFDSLKIYESEKYYTVITQSDIDKSVTRTNIGKIHWRVVESFYHKSGEEEKRIK